MPRATVARYSLRMTALTITQMLQQGLAHHQAGSTAEAQRLYRQVLVVDPQCAEALHLYGILLDQGGQHAAAIDLLRRAVAADPKAARFCISLGAALTGQGRFDEAAAVLRQALGLSPRHPGIYNNLGNIYIVGNVGAAKT
ncbi:MAG: tetratricopeptide repeat protein, partial [Phycisphaerae bacterium]